MAVTQYIGARYVPLFAEPIEWSDQKEYEPLTIVLDKGNSYTSRQFVPKGIDISNTEFWANTGNYNAQIEQYRKEVGQVKVTVQELTNKTAYSFDSVDDMVKYDLPIGVIAITASFHKNTNIGGGIYIIGTSTANEFDIIQLDNGNSAQLITDNQIEIDKLGCTHDADASDAINFAIDKYDYVVANGSYICNKTIDFKKSKKHFEFNAIESTADVAIDFGGYNSVLKGTSLTAPKVAVRTCEYLNTETSEISISRINAETGITSSDKHWMQYTSIHDCNLKCSVNPIIFTKNQGSVTWVNENFFNNIKCDGTFDYGITLKVELSETDFLNSQLEENIFTNIAFENGGGGIFLQNISACEFHSVRTQEIPNGKLAVKFKEGCMRNKINFSGAVPITKIDFSENAVSVNRNDWNSNNNLINGVIIFGNVYIQTPFLLNGTSLLFDGRNTFTPGKSVNTKFSYNSSPYSFFNTIELTNITDNVIVLNENYAPLGINELTVKLTNASLELKQKNKTIYKSSGPETKIFTLKTIYENTWIVINN